MPTYETLSRPLALKCPSSENKDAGNDLARFRELWKDPSIDRIKTGSRAWGLHHSGSDHDYVMRAADIEDCVDLALLEQYGEMRGLPSWGFKLFTFEPPVSLPHGLGIMDLEENTKKRQPGVHRVLNIIVALDDEQFTSWRRATWYFSLLCKHDEALWEEMKDKKKRARFFEGIRTGLGMGDYS